MISGPECEGYKAVVEAVIEALTEEAIDHAERGLTGRGESIKRISLTPKLVDALAAVSPTLAAHPIGQTKGTDDAKA